MHRRTSRDQIFLHVRFSRGGWIVLSVWSLTRCSYTDLIVRLPLLVRGQIRGFWLSEFCSKSIPMIFCSTWYARTWCKKSTFHFLLSWIKILLAFFKVSTIFGFMSFLKIWFGEFKGIQLWDQSWIFCPFHIFHIASSSIIWMSFHNPFQNQEQFCFVLMILSGEILFEVFFFKTLEVGELGHFIILHVVLVNMTRLNFSNCLKPKPPLVIGLQIDLQAFGRHPLVILFACH